MLTLSGSVDILTPRKENLIMRELFEKKRKHFFVLSDGNHSVSLYQVSAASCR
jgi:hypothetical protein